MTTDGDESDRLNPTVNQPLNAKPRPRVLPAVLLVVFVIALVLFYLFGLEVLVGAD